MMIRGVNLGGWLLVDRFITPYLFAVTSCHTQGNFCWYPSQSSAPPSLLQENVCDLYHCKPLQTSAKRGEPKDFPHDPFTLMSAFTETTIRRRYMEYHWDNFVTHDDIVKLSDAGITHVRVPVPFWILEDEDLWNTQSVQEPWVSGGWMYFIRLVSWCRQQKIEVWPDVHVPTSMMTGMKSKDHSMQRTLDALETMVKAIQEDGLDDVVTGVGILSAIPEKSGEAVIPNCTPQDMEEYYNEALRIVRSTLGDDVAVYQSDLWNKAEDWNHGWWTDTRNHHDTFLGSSYKFRSVETPSARHLSPKQHVALVCQDFDRETSSCCYEDSQNTRPAAGISRIVGEWSAAYDVDPAAKLQQVMNGIAKSGTIPEDRPASKERIDFLRQFVKAQMVTYESPSSSPDVSSGWFFSNFKMEGTAFPEYDYLHGLQDGWISPTLESDLQSRYGSCYDILQETSDESRGVVDEFPPPSRGQKYEDFNDDVVTSHGNIKGKNGYTNNNYGKTSNTNGGYTNNNYGKTSNTYTQNRYGDDDTLEGYDFNDNGENKKGWFGRPAKEKKGSFLSFPMLWVIGFAALAIKYVFYSPRTYGYSSVYQGGGGGGNAATLYV